MTDRSNTNDSLLFSIGHSNHSLDHFVGLLIRHRIEILTDVRSYPHSTYAPQFNAESLKKSLAAAGIRYLFLGKELGGRPEEKNFFDKGGKVFYAEVAKSAQFQDGIRRLQVGSEKYRVALMCSEEDPAQCHRHLLIGRVLTAHGIILNHIRSDGTVQTDEELTPRESQTMLFDAMEDDLWKSLRSVSQRRAPLSSSES